MIQLPTWLSNFWLIYGDMITPVLVTLMVSLLTYLAIKIKADAKVNKAKADLQIEALKEVANREDNKPQLEDQSTKIEQLTTTVAYLADMINLAFQNSNLTPETKDSLASLANKIKYGTEEDLVKELEAQKNELQEQVKILTDKLYQSATTPVETVEEPKRMRR